MYEDMEPESLPARERELKLILSRMDSELHESLPARERELKHQVC